MPDVFTKSTLDYVDDEGTFSIRRQSYIDVDGVDTEVGEPHRRAFEPGQFEELAAYAPEFKGAADYIWTQDVLNAWQEKQRRSQSDSGLHPHQRRAAR